MGWGEAPVTISPSRIQSRGNNLQRQAAFQSGGKGPEQFQWVAFLLFLPLALAGYTGGHGLGIWLFGQRCLFF